MTLRPALSLLAGLVLALSGCSRPEATPDSAAPAPALPATDAPAQPAASASAALPASGFENVPGWLGFTVQPVAQRTQAWTPAHPNASVVIVDADAWSQTVAPGSRFRLVSREGNLPLILSAVSGVPHGCDGIENTMAAFRTPHALAEQLAWILPESDEIATAMPVISGAMSERQRSWHVGPLAITTQLDRANAGRLEVRRGNEVLLVVPFEQPGMEGADGAALDLTRNSEIGVPYPEAAFRLDEALTIVVLRTVSYEGANFEVLALRDSLERVGTQYVYLCAFWSVR